MPRAMLLAPNAPRNMSACVRSVCCRHDAISALRMGAALPGVVVLLVEKKATGSCRIVCRRNRASMFARLIGNSACAKYRCGGNNSGAPRFARCRRLPRRAVVSRYGLSQPPDQWYVTPFRSRAVCAKAGCARSALNKPNVSDVVTGVVRPAGFLHFVGVSFSCGPGGLFADQPTNCGPTPKGRATRAGRSRHPTKQPRKQGCFRNC